MSNSASQTMPYSADAIHQLIASILYGGWRVYLRLKEGGRCQADATFTETNNTIELPTARKIIKQAT